MMLLLDISLGGIFQSHFLFEYVRTVNKKLGIPFLINHHFVTKSEMGYQKPKSCKDDKKNRIYHMDDPFHKENS